MLIAFIAGFAMMIGDICQGLYVILLDRGQAKLAGMFDGLQDITNVVAIGGGASTVYHHALDAITALTLFLLLVGSIAGASIGNSLSHRFTRKPPVTQSHI
jgi:uncharacterized membrane protein YfcA